MRPWVAVIFCAARPLFGGEPLLDVEGHELRDEFLGRRRDVLPGRLVELVLGSLDLGLDDALAISRVPEGRITRQQDVEDPLNWLANSMAPELLVLIETCFFEHGHMQPI